MIERFPFQYAVLRYIHDQQTQEFLNIGLVLTSAKARFFRAEVSTRYGRIADAFPGIDGEFYRAYASRLQSILDEVGKAVSTDQMKLLDARRPELDSLLNQVLPRDDTSIQFSPSMGGAAGDLEGIFTQLYGQLIERYVKVAERETRDDSEVWNSFKTPLDEMDLTKHLQPHTVVTPVEVFEFRHAWKNGRWNVLQPVSFDLKYPQSIRKKAREWLGASVVLHDRPELTSLCLLLGAPPRGRREAYKAYGQAKDILKEEVNGFLRFVEEEKARDFADELKREIG
jgi:hypothetical protein